MIAFDESFLLALEQQRQSASARARQERYLTMLNPLPGERVLDLGCGSGAFCRMLGPLVAPSGRVIGDRPRAASDRPRAAVVHRGAPGRRCL